MSNHVAIPTSAPPQQASTSTNPSALTPASYHPAPRPSPTPPTLSGHAAPVPAPIPAPLPFHRIDTHQIKQQLHDALGEAGLPYWKALNGYLLGQVGRHELEALVRGWLKGKNLQLHNQLLTSLLHNASSPLIAHVPPSPLNLHKKRKGGINAPDFDSDAAFIEPKQRVQYWVMGMGGKERDRVRRAVEQGEADGPPAVPNEVITNGRKRKWSTFNSNAQHLPLAQSGRTIPSSNQLATRLTEVAQSCGLDVPQATQRDVGEFMGVGLTSHIGEVLHGVTHLTSRDRPGVESMRVPLGVNKNGANGVANGVMEHSVPPPSLQTMQYLFTIHPGLNPQASPTLYKLESGLTQAENENASPPPGRRPSQTKAPHPLSLTAPPQPAAGTGPPTLSSTPAQVAASPVKAASALHAAAGQGKIEAVSSALINTGLLKIDKAGRDDEGGERKREKKHNLHWKYEDPALILKDILG